MLIATDGACKRLGKPDCTSTGVAWIQTEDGQMLFKAFFEEESTSQRGEIRGLIEALTYAKDKRQWNEDVVIITDSEYLLNTVSLEWCFKWRANGWIAGSGDPAKNADLWKVVCELLEQIGKDNVYMQWTKGHLMDYTASNTKAALVQDATGVELYTRICSMANRPSEHTRIAESFNHERAKHNQLTVPEDVAVNWVTANVTADVLAAYIESVFDAAYLARVSADINL